MNFEEYLILGGYLDSSDDEEEIEGTRENRHNSFNDTNKKFLSNYRLTKELAKNLIEIVRQLMVPSRRLSDLSIEIKVLTALNFFAKGSYQSSIGNHKNAKISQGTVSNCITEVVRALNHPSVFGHWVKFPRNIPEMMAISQQFYELYRLPGVVGCIDCTHVAIHSPPNDGHYEESIYVNRKGYHSINTQLICDANLRIINVNALFPGSSHDSFIWNQSNVSETMEQLHRHGNGRHYLIGATKEIGTALTRVCLRHRAIETRMKTFISTLTDTLISPLAERAEEWRRGGCATGALSREHARECKRARAELRRRVLDAQRNVRKARRAPPDAKRRADVSVQDVQERKQQLEEMEEKAVKAALIEERSRFCHFVSLLNPVVECEVAMLAEVGHLQEGSEQLMRHTTEPRTLPPASLQVICDTKSRHAGWDEPAAHSPSPSPRPGSRKSSLTSISSLGSQCSENQRAVSASTVSCSTPLSNASSTATLPLHEPLSLSQPARRVGSVCSADSGFRSGDARRQLSLCVDNGSDSHSVSSECTTPAKSTVDDDEHCDNRGNAGASATWPDLKDTAQFERAASAIMAARPHTISAGYSGAHQRPALSAHTFAESPPRDQQIYARPPLPTRCSSLERPSVPAKTNANTGQQDLKTGKPSSLPPHLTKETPMALYVNMSELASMAAARAQLQLHHAADGTPRDKEDHAIVAQVCSESSASESSLESSSGYGSQGAFAAEDQALQHQLQHQEADSEIVTLRRSSDASIAAARESFSISLGSLEEAVRSLDETSEVPAFATIGKKPSVPKRRPVSMSATVWSRRGSSTSLGKPPPPVRRSSSISRPQRPFGQQGTGPPSPQLAAGDELPPPPAFLLQPDRHDLAVHQNSVAETVKQLTELKHMPASPGLARRSQPAPAAGPAGCGGLAALSTFQQAKTNFSGSNVSLNSAGNLNPIYGQTGHRIMQYVEQNSVYVRKGALNASSGDLYREAAPGTPSTPNYGENNFSSFGPRVGNDSHYGQTGFKVQQEKQYEGIYARPAPLEGEPPLRSPLPPRRVPRPHSADRRRAEQSSLIASLSAKLAPQLSPRTARRAQALAPPDAPPKPKGVMAAAVQPAFLDKLSATIRLQRRQLDSPRASTVRDIINAHAAPDPRVCHTSLMEQIKRGATLKRNKHCNDRSAPKIR